MHKSSISGVGEVGRLGRGGLRGETATEDGEFEHIRDISDVNAGLEVVE